MVHMGRSEVRARHTRKRFGERGCKVFPFQQLQGGGGIYERGDVPSMKDVATSRVGGGGTRGYVFRCEMLCLTFEGRAT